MVSQVGDEFKIISELKDYLVLSKHGDSIIVGTPQVLELFVHNTFQKRYQANNIQIVEFSPDDNFVIVVDKQDNTSRCIILETYNFVEV